MTPSVDGPTTLSGGHIKRVIGSHMRSFDRTPPKDIIKMHYNGINQRWQMVAIFVDRLEPFSGEPSQTINGTAKTGFKLKVTALLSPDVLCLAEVAFRLLKK